MQEVIRAHGERLWSPDWQAEHNAYLQGRAQNTQQYKPGSQEILLLFSARDGGTVFQFPLYKQLRHLIEPIFFQVRLSTLAMIQKAHMCPKTLISLMSMGDQCILASSLIDIWPSWACNRTSRMACRSLGVRISEN